MINIFSHDILRTSFDTFSSLVRMAWHYDGARTAYKPTLKSYLTNIERYVGLAGIRALEGVIHVLIVEAEGGPAPLLEDDDVVLNRCLTRW
jgi:hypothetical protein